MVINSAADEDQRDNGNNDDNQDDVPVQRSNIMIAQLLILGHLRHTPLSNTRISEKLPVIALFFGRFIKSSSCSSLRGLMLCCQRAHPSTIRSHLIIYFRSSSTRIKDLRMPMGLDPMLSISISSIRFLSCSNFFRSLVSYASFSTSRSFSKS